MNIAAHKPAYTTLMETPDKLPDDKWSVIINYLGMLFAAIILAILGWVGKFIGKKLEAYLARIEAAADTIDKVGDRIKGLEDTDARIEKKITEMSTSMEKRMDAFERRLENVEKKK